MQLALHCIVAAVAAAIFIGSGATAINCYYRTPAGFSAGNTSPGNGTSVDCRGYSVCYAYTSFDGGFQYDAGCSMAADGVCARQSACVVCNESNCNSATPSSISCYYRSNATLSSGNGAVANCTTGISTCYAYTDNGTYYYAGCGGCNSDASLTCTECNTSNCNTVTPSSITCYYRAQTLAIYNGPGTAVQCSTGVTSCYSYTDGNYTYGDCGSCSTDSIGSCVKCSSNLCNTHLPSNISCHYRGGQNKSSTPNTFGYKTPCSTGITSCYSYLIPYGMLFAGCGNYTGTYHSEQYNGTGRNRITCSDRDYCNSATTMAPPSVGIFAAIAAAAMMSLLG